MDKEAIEKYLEDYFDVEEALVEMLRKSLVFANGRKYWCDWEGALKPETICLFLNCNDVFAWGCADAEEIAYNEVQELYTMWKNDKYGDMKWVCKKRNLRPQQAWMKRLKEEGAWDAFFESLPENKC